MRDSERTQEWKGGVRTARAMLHDGRVLLFTNNPSACASRRFHHGRWGTGSEHHHAFTWGMYMKTSTSLTRTDLVAEV